MTDKHLVEIFFVVDADGNYEVGVDADQAMERFDENIGGKGPRRVIKFAARVTLPEEEEDAGEIDVADTAGETTEVEAA